VKIRIAPREGVVRYEEAYRRSPRPKVVYDDMLATAKFMLRQASDNSAILYNTHDLLKKMIDFGFGTPEVASMYERVRYQLSRGKEQYVLNLLSTVKSTPAIADDVLFTVYQGSKITAQDLNKKGVWPDVIDVVAPISADLLAVDGKLIIVTAAGWVYALRAKDGASAWQHKHFERVYEKAHLAARSGMIYVLTSDGALTALSAADGSKRWSTPGDSVASGVIAAGEGAIVITTQSAKWIVEGSVRWERPLSAKTFASFTGGGSLILASGSEISLIDLRTQQTSWTHALAAPVSASIFHWGDRILVPLENGTVIALALVAPRGGSRMVWKLKLETEVGEPHKHDHEHKHEHDHDHDHEHKEPLKPGTKVAEVCRSPGALGAGKLYLMGQETLFCIDARTGELEWIYEALGTSRTGLLTAGGAVFGGYEDPETKVTFLKVINTGIAATSGWSQFGGNAARSFSSNR
jgi:outer membrane protein assembly factor BamB